MITIYCLTKAEYPERKKNILRQDFCAPITFVDAKPPIEEAGGIVGRIGRAIARSHAQIMQLHLDTGSGPFLLLEDDALIIDKSSYITAIQSPPCGCSSLGSLLSDRPYTFTNTHAMLFSDITQQKIDSFLSRIGEHQSTEPCYIDAYGDGINFLQISVDNNIKLPSIRRHGIKQESLI